MGKSILKSSLIDDKNVVAFFTTRDLPLKAGEREDLIQEVENNKKLVCEGLNIPPKNLVIPVQTHSDNVAILDAKRHRGIEAKEEKYYASLHPDIFASKNLSRLTSHVSLYENTDALITDQPQIALVLNFADCVPIIFYDPVKKVIAASHAGWKGTVQKIGPETVEKMIETFGCKAKDIIALIGPAIGKCCFEAKDDVLQQLRDSISSQDTEAISDTRADLKLINKLQLLAMGVKKIDLCEYCTSCQSELFFSYRRENGKTARHSAVVMVNGR